MRGMNTGVKHMAMRILVRHLAAAVTAFGIVRGAAAANARNAYVSVSCDAVSKILTTGSNFYVICPNDVDGQLGVYVRALRPYRLVAPNTEPTLISVGGVCSYRVSDEDGTEEFFSGSIYVLKVEIDPAETNVCWKASRCTLSLTADSEPGGAVRWTSRPSGISGTGRSVSFSPYGLSPGSYVVTAKSEYFPSCVDQAMVNIVKTEEVHHRIGIAASWSRFARPQKILFGRTAMVKAVTVPQSLTDDSVITWDGTYGAVGVGMVTACQYQGIPSVSDSDVKTVFTNCGPDVPEEFLVCAKVLGIHSNVSAQNAGITDGHAWLTVTRYDSGAPITIPYGLWGNRQRAKDGSDVHVGLESESGLSNRYFLLSPSQYEALVGFLDADCEWSPLYTCANWAEDGYRVATGESISSSDLLVFGTPRALGDSIAEKESQSPTLRDVPYDGGEEAASTSSISEGSWSGSSFP